MRPADVPGTQSGPAPAGATAAAGGAAVQPGLVVELCGHNLQFGWP
jgi:hypothetical protein